LIGWFSLIACGLSAHAAPFMRYPTASKSGIAFVAYDDLWITSLQGGKAHRLTHDPGAITTPLFSPDGHWIAFTSRRGGLRDVYVIPSAGGVPTRLTYEASSFADGAMVVAWTPDSRRVIFLSHRATPVVKLVRAFSVPLEGGLAEQLPLDLAGMMSFSPDGRTIAYNRIFRNLELRKRYIGGQAQDIYTYDFNTQALERVTDWKGTDTAPMWFGRKIYFLSDRGSNFRENIWSYDLDSKAFRQITDFRDYDVDWPSLGGSTITFQQGGRLFAIDLPYDRLHEVKVEIEDDGDRTRVRTMNAGLSARATDVMGQVDYALSPDGGSLLLSAWGDIFRLSSASVSPKSMPPGSKTSGTMTSGAGAQDLTNTPGADEDHPSWSPDGRLVAYETDGDGEQQLAIRPVQGGREHILTHFDTGYFYTPVWSPLGNSLVVPDANHALWWIHLDASAPQRIASDPFAEIRDAAFSPDGRWLAYSTERPTQLRAIHLYELATGRDSIVSSPMESDRSPVFSADGRLLLFLSRRNEQPFVSDRDDESLISTVNSDGIYAVSLDRTAPSALHAPTSLATTSNAVGNARPLHIDLDNFMARAVALPVTPAVIDSLATRGSEVMYQTRPVQLLDGDLAGTRAMLHALSLVTMKDRVLVEGLDTFSLSADGTRVAYRREEAWHIATTAAGTQQEGEAVDLRNLMATVDPPREWAEMFENAWRLDRDVFFSKVMNGTDWKAVHDAYAKLLPRLGSEDDFLYILGQMQGEIASSHTFMAPPMTPGAGNDPRQPEHTGLLAADYQLDSASGRYRFARIHPGDQTRPEMRGPLGEPGLNLREGDYLLAINGRELRAPAQPDGLLAGLTSEVTLTVAASPSGPGRDIRVAPLTDETHVRRHDWIEQNREVVDRLSQGRLGYIFVTDFSAEGSKDFVRQFYPQRDKAGLIFDVRWNRGGFTSQAVLDVLRRPLAGVFVNREGAVTPLPGATAPRILVTLTNYASASDGDQFPYFFHQFKLGKIVGEKTWGGVQGINGPWNLMDGSSITIPKDSLASLDAHWIIENEGVTPDVPIEPAPGEAVTHDDSELSAAVRTALEQLGEKPPPALQAPAPIPAYPADGNVPGASFGDDHPAVAGHP
jgi:tricorn protease